MNQYFVNPDDMTVKSQLTINQTLKDFPALDKKQIGEIYTNIVDGCIFNDDYADAIGTAIENQYGRETSVIVAHFTEKIYNEQLPDNIVLDLTEEDIENFEDMLSDI